MANIVENFTNYRIRSIEIAEAEYYETLIRTLDKIEDDVVRLAGKDLPTQAGKLIELQAAVSIRPKIRAIMQREFLGWADTLTKRGFNKQAKTCPSLHRMNAMYFLFWSSVKSYGFDTARSREFRRFHKQ